MFAVAAAIVVLLVLTVRYDLRRHRPKLARSNHARPQASSVDFRN